jgi:prepilin-type N-terminal cleavage/methylation domain-containing protein
MTINNGNKNPGFTLLELLAALAILAVLSIAIFSFSDIQTDDEKRVACMSTMSGVTNTFSAWAVTVTPNDPNGEINLCREAKAAADAWNSECSDVSATLPTLEACL